MRGRTGRRRAHYRTGTIDGRVARPSSPLQVFGSSLAFWLAPERWTAASWADETGNLTARSDPQCVQFDGVDDTMAADFTAPLLAGTRPYVLAIVKNQDGDPGTGNRISFFLSDAASQTIVSLGMGSTFASTRTRRGSMRTSNNFSFNGPAPDNLWHVSEVNFEPATTGRYFVDGTAYDENSNPSFPALTDALADNVTRLTIGTDNPNARITQRVRAIVVLRDMPNGSELAAIRAWATAYKDGDTALPSPLAIVGSARCACQLLVDDATVSSWADQSGNITLAQATSGQQPVVKGNQRLSLAVGGMNGRDVPLSDGVDDYMVGDMLVPFAALSRPAVFMVRRFVSDPGTGSRASLLLSSTTAGLTMAAFFLSTVSSQRRLVLGQTVSGAVGKTHHGPLGDLSPRLTKVAWPASTASRYSVDGVDYDAVTSGSQVSDALPSQAGRIHLADNGLGTTVAANLHFGDIFGVRVQPTAEQLAAVHAWVTYRWGIRLP